MYRIRSARKYISSMLGCGIGLDGSMLDPTCVIAKDVKSCTYCCYVRCETSIEQVGGMPWPQAGATHYHAQLCRPDKGREI